MMKSVRKESFGLCCRVCAGIMDRLSVLIVRACDGGDKLFIMEFFWELPD